MFNKDEKIVLAKIIDTFINLSIEKLSFTKSIVEEFIRSNCLIDGYNVRFSVSEEYSKYLVSHFNQIKLLLYILLNFKKLNLKDVNEIVDLMDDDMNKLFAYTYDMLDNLIKANDMQASYYFEIPNYNVETFDKNNYFEYKNYVKGYSVDSIGIFLTDVTHVYVDELYDEIIENLRVVEATKNDYNLFAGINDNGNVMVPRIRDSKSTLIVLHELIHKYLLINKDIINDDKIVYGEELPILYEMLYKDYNKYCKEKVHKNNISMKLYKDYNNEPIDEQIKKLKKMI